MIAHGAERNEGQMRRGRGLGRVGEEGGSGARDKNYLDATFRDQGELARKTGL